MPNPLPDLTDAVRSFLDRPFAATLATLGADGSPHQAVIWFRLEPDGRVLVNSRRGRRWPADLDRDPRCSLAIVDPADRNRWIGIDGELDEVVDDVGTAREDIVDLAHRYDEADESSLEAFRTQPRVTYLIGIRGLHVHLEDE
jgi:PPOX class probable F420-dependent enzyme